MCHKSKRVCGHPWCCRNGGINIYVIPDQDKCTFRREGRGVGRERGSTILFVGSVYVVQILTVFPVKGRVVAKNKEQQREWREGGGLRI